MELLTQYKKGLSTVFLRSQLSLAKLRYKRAKENKLSADKVLAAKAVLDEIWGELISRN